MKREHNWLPNMSCGKCGCWAATYEARMECRGGEPEPAAVAEAPKAIDWFAINAGF